MASIPAFNASISLTDNPAHDLSGIQKAALTALGLGVLGMIVALASSLGSAYPILSLGVISALFVGGAMVYVWDEYRARPPGIKNDGIMFSSNQARGLLGWTAGIVLTGLYVLLYWFPATLDGLIRVTDPLSYTLAGQPATQWFLYGTIYTLAVLVMGFRAILKYRHSRYQIIRTLSVMTAQLFLAYLIPQILVLFQQPEYYFSYFWPLDYDQLWPSIVGSATENPLGTAFIAFGAFMIFIGTPLLTYFFGKRWYCSWVCGCGGLAETAGDPYRHLSDKSLKAWKVERWMIHSVLVFAIVTTGLLWINSATEGAVLGGLSQTFSAWYGFGIGLVFFRRGWGWVLPDDGEPGVVPVRVPDGGDPRHAAAVLLPLSHHHEWWAVHLVRQLLDLLRDGDRRAVVRAARAEHRPVELRRVRHLLGSVPARGC